MGRIMADISKTIFTKCLFQSSSLKERLSKKYFALRPDSAMSFPFVLEMLENHRKCPYWTLLQQACPSVLDRNRASGETVMEKRCRKISSSKLIENSAEVSAVYLYLRRVCLKIVPLHVFGTKQNMMHFLKNIHKLLSLQVYGKISLSHIVEGIKTRPMLWLRSYSQGEKRNMLYRVIHFLVTDFIGPLVQSFFCVRESTTYKNRLFFYRKKTWHRLTQMASSKFVQMCGLKKVSGEWVESKIRRGKCLGMSVVRFLVKTSSLRPVANFSSRKKGKTSINDHLKTLLSVLTFEKTNTCNSQAFGATIMGIDDFHHLWKKFVAFCRKQCFARLYFVKLDIEKCFDTVKPCLLYSIVCKTLGERHVYKVYRYKKFIRKDGEVKPVWFESLEHPNLVVRTEGIKIEYCGSYVVKKDVLLDKLRALLFCNVSVLGKQHHVQTVGISQGSCLSSILCGLYYGAMDQCILNGIQSKTDLFMRMTDDILYVTPRRSNAMNFLKVMLEGIPEFNCRVNLDKCCINFCYSHPVLGDIPSLHSGSLMEYCGLAIDTKTLHVYIDFSNYKNVRTCDTISYDLTEHAGTNIRKKMLMSVRPKCYSVLFDHSINTEEDIHYNIVCVFALCAVKFHCFVLYLPPRKRVLNNAAFFTDIILSLPKALMSTITSKTKKLKEAGQWDGLSVSLKAVKALCYHTFLFKLTRHHQMYVPVIKQLAERIKAPKPPAVKKLPEVFSNMGLR